MIQDTVPNRIFVLVFHRMSKGCAMKKNNLIEKQMQQYIQKLNIQLRDGSTIPMHSNRQEEPMEKIIRLLKSIGPIAKA